MTCPGSFWSTDRIELCHRQRYLEFYPMLVTLVFFAAVTAVAAIPRIKLARRRQSPLFVDNEAGVPTPVQPPTDTAKGPIIERPKLRSEKEAAIVIRARTIGDRLRLIAELVLVTGELLLSIISWVTPAISDAYAEYAPNMGSLLVAFHLYVFGIVLYRVIGMNSVEPLAGRPFRQCAYIYTITLIVSAIALWSADTDPYGAESEKVCAAFLVLCLLKWIILFTSPLGDVAPRVYTVPGLEPSPEPTSSLLRAMVCAWNQAMIVDSYRRRIEPEDVWELEELDHSYAVIDDFKKYPESQGFLWRMAKSFKLMIFLNLFLGCLGASLSMLPTLFVNRILRYVEDPQDVPRSVAWLFVLGLGAAFVIQHVIENQALYWGRKLSVHIRAVVIGSIYRKALFRKVASGDKDASGDADQPVRDAAATAQEPVGETPAGETPLGHAPVEGSTAAGKDGEEEDEDTKFDAGNSGAVINLMSVDAFKVAEFCAYLHYLVASPLALLVSIYYLYTVLSWSAFAGVFIMVASMPLNYVTARKMGEIQDELMAVTDKRVERTNEVLQAIRIIKFFAWEHKFKDRILELRGKELKLLMSRYIWWSIGSMVFFIMPLLITVASFASYVVLQHRQLTSSVAFTALAIFNILRYPLDDIANNISRYMAAKVSVDRIAAYLKLEETPKYRQLDAKPRGPDSPRIGFEDATFQWDANKDSFKLRDLNIAFVEGDLNVVIGPTGSGKTSLLLALLGEMTLEKGRIYLPGTANRRTAPVDKATGLADTVAYCPQQAWLVNDTLKNNILFAAPYDRRRYQAVLDACELQRDLEILQDGDQTLIGDKGIALSGGQKQRVSLARALYSNSKHLILDDCLSAVDSHTSEALYKNALTGAQAEHRTVLLVSHNVALTVSKAAHVVVLADGRVSAQGTPHQLSESGALGADELVLRSARESVLSRTSSRVSLAQAKAHKPTPEETLDAEQHPELEPDNKVEEEERGLGSIPWSTYKTYIDALGGKVWWILTLTLIVAAPVANYLESWWLKVWSSSQPDEHVSGPIGAAVSGITTPVVSGAGYALAVACSVAGAAGSVASAAGRSLAATGHSAASFLVAAGVEHDTAHSIVYYATIYILFGLLYAFISVTRELFSYSGSVRASKRLFARLLDSVVRARVRFFDSTPTGRIINRFSKDIETVDQDMMPELLFFIASLLDAVAVTVVISYVTPAFIPAAVIVVYLYWLVGRVYLTCSRELKRLESVSRSPIFQQFGETLAGAVAIRAFGDVQRFQTTNMNAVDYNHRPYLYLWLANRWLAFWSSMLSMCVCVLAAFFIVYNSAWISAGMAGVSLSYSMMFGDAILWIVRMYAQVEIDMNSMERLQEYIDIDHEAAAVIPESRPPANWPSKGAIDFNNLSLRYADELPLVIKNVSFKIDGGLKVGIVGRTGAGKSTIITALFRMLEPAGGSISIDGLDISTIGLDDLRNGLAIIPQDPTLFKGTLRSNLDPFDEYSDNEIFTALSRVKLVPVGTTAATAAATTTAKDENANKFLDLQSEVSEGGANLSQGQRQLLCLSRSLLKQPRVLLLDEATASIDYDTDAMIQNTIRDEFTDVTILTIAHRLRTIADYDRIVVLERGEVAQFGTPKELLSDEKGIFYGMCEKSGELSALKQLAGVTSGSSSPKGSSKKTSPKK